MIRFRRRQRGSWFILLVVAVIAPVLALCAIWSVRSNKNRVEDWLPSGFRETMDLRWFRDRFVSDQFVLVSWEGCRLGDDPSKAGAAADDPRIEQLVRLLSDRPVDAAPEDDQARSASALRADGPDEVSVPDLATAGRYVKQVVTARQLLNQLTAPPAQVPYSLAVQRLNGSLIGPDGHQTAVIISLTDEAIGNFRTFLSRGHAGFLQPREPRGVLFTALEACGIDTDLAYIGGPPVDNVAIDEEGERTMLRLAGLAGLLGTSLAWWSLRSWRLTLIVMICGILSTVASLAAVWLTGESTDAILLSMPALVYVLAISGAIHLINYYRDALREGAGERAPWVAIAHGWKPTLLCNVTTSMGLLSLCTSELTPIRKFGIFSALGVMIMLLVLFIYLPAALSLFGGGARAVRKRATRPGPTPPRASNWSLRLGLSFDAFWGWFGGKIIDHRTAVSVTATILIGLVSFGIFQTHTSIDLMKLFSSQARILHDYRWLESNVGRMVPLEVVLRFDPALLQDPQAGRAGNESRLNMLQRMRIVRDLQESLHQKFGAEGQDVISPSLSAVTFVAPLPNESRGTSSALRRAAVNARLQRSYDQLLQSGYLRVDPVDGAELWRISIRVAAFRDVDYGRFAEQLRQFVNPQLVQISDQSGVSGEAGSPALSAVYTGVVPVVYKAQRSLLNSLIESSFWSFMTVTPLLMFVSRGVRAGMVAMLPNLLPIICVFGGMGWLGVNVDIGAMMSASIALGVAVDDTIHYLSWFREDLIRTGDRTAAILAAYRRCATPTLQAALVNGLGLSVFGFSTFLPTQKFGLLMLVILIAGVIAELVLLPALLASPLGAVFDTRVYVARSTATVPIPEPSSS